MRLKVETIHKVLNVEHPFINHVKKEENIWKDSNLEKKCSQSYIFPNCFK